MSLLISNCFYLGNFRSKDYHCCANISFTFIYPHVSDTLVNLNPSWWSHYHHVAIFSSLIFPTGDVSLAGKPAAPELTSTAFNDLVALSSLGKKTMTNALRHHWRTSLQIWVVLFHKFLVNMLSRQDFSFIQGKATIESNWRLQFSFSLSCSPQRKHTKHFL